jgi:hypothetical protein
VNLIRKLDNLTVIVLSLDDASLYIDHALITRVCAILGLDDVHLITSLNEASLLSTSVVEERFQFLAQRRYPLISRGKW